MSHPTDCIFRLLGKRAETDRADPHRSQIQRGRAFPCDRCERRLRHLASATRVRLTPANNPDQSATTLPLSRVVHRKPLPSATTIRIQSAPAHAPRVQASSQMCALPVGWPESRLPNPRAQFALDHLRRISKPARATIVSVPPRSPSPPPPAPRSRSHSSAAAPDCKRAHRPLRCLQRALASAS